MKKKLYDAYTTNVDTTKPDGMSYAEWVGSHRAWLQPQRLVRTESVNMWGCLTADLILAVIMCRSRGRWRSRDGWRGSCAFQVGLRFATGLQSGSAQGSSLPLRKHFLLQLCAGGGVCLLLCLIPLMLILFVLALIVYIMSLLCRGCLWVCCCEKPEDEEEQVEETAADGTRGSIPDAVNNV